MPSKRPSEDGSVETPSKISRTDQAGDFSGSVRKKLTGTSRTGQACDRCKVRKIRCDARAGGCSPCIQNNLECKTTDRITGRATSRGHTEHIESENIHMKQYIIDLRAQLQENGIEARQSPMLPVGYVENGSQSGFGWPQQMLDLSQILNSDAGDKSRGRGNALPDYRSSALGDNYLGVSGANDWLSPIKGTSLALFGMELDLADFITNDAEEAFSPTSYENFLSIAMSGAPQEAPNLPQYGECRAFCEWYFKSVNCHAPLVHKPAILEIVDRLHTDVNYQPNNAETVQLHMVLAMMLFQYSTRNGIPNDWAKHYRYAASFLPKLVTERSLANMQAIALIALHLRNFTKPGAAWFMSSLALTMCIEMGFHRSVTAWSKSIPEMDQHEIEMRKRVFWSLLTIHCSISNKLGRPLAVRLEDFDVEFPKALHDNVASEDPIDDWHKCSYRVSLYNFKWVLLDIQVQTSIYSVRAPPHSYELTVQKLDRDLDLFMRGIPIELSGGPETAQDDRVCSLYLQFGIQELNLLIHHPAVCRTQAPEVMDKNLDACLEASSKLLEIAINMRGLRSLDTTWLNATVWLSAMFVTLFTYSQRKDRITSAELNGLKESMDTWLDIIGDIGQMLGSGPRLEAAVRNIVDAAVNNISRHLAAKTASAAVASAGITRSPTGPSGVDALQDGQAYSAPAGYTPAYVTDQGNGNTTDANSGTGYLGGDDNSMGQQPASYPPNFAYPDPSGNSVPSYPSNTLPFDGATYGSTDDIKPDLSAQLAAHNAGHALQQQQQHHHHHHHHHVQQQQQQQQQQQRQPSQPNLSAHDQSAQNFLAAFGNPHQSQNGGNSVYPHAPPQQQTQQNLLGPAAWRHFAQDMFNQMGPPQVSGPGGYDVQSASALIALGNQNDAKGMAAVTLQSQLQDAAAVANGIGVIQDGLWPLITYGPVSNTPLQQQQQQQTNGM